MYIPIIGESLYNFSKNWRENTYIYGICKSLFISPKNWRESKGAKGRRLNLNPALLIENYLLSALCRSHVKVSTRFERYSQSSSSVLILKSAFCKSARSLAFSLSSSIAYFSIFFLPFSPLGGESLNHLLYLYYSRLAK